MENQFDVAIIGAGPAGCACAISLQDSGLRTVLIDKSTFPRDKICGDAISPDVVNQLHKLSLDTGRLFDQLGEKLPSSAVRFISPDYSHSDLDLRNHGLTGFVSPRKDFDNFLFERASFTTNVKTVLGKPVKSITYLNNGLEIQIDQGEILHAKMIIGADGANSIVGRQLADHELDRDHHCAGLRQYWENVSGFSGDNAVELHFYKELLPGYFWMFPLPGNKANIGLGLLSSYAQKHKTNLKALLSEIITEHPNVKDRFAQARPLEEIKGFGLPLGSRKRKLSGNGYLLTGDAASLINPLSGEGIANAVRSGRVAAAHVKTAFKLQRFDSAFNVAYDREIYHLLWPELQLNYWIQVAMRRPRLCNFIIKHAIGHPLVRDSILSGFSIKKIRGLLINPLFYFKLLKGPNSSL